MKFRCPHSDCDKSLSSKFNLQRHIDTCHLRIKRFECAVCFKRFASKQNLHEHEFIHESQDLIPTPAPQVTVVTGVVEVPKLSDLLWHSTDTLFRPYLHVNRIYPFPVVMEEVQLAAIEDAKEPTTLPKLEEMMRF